MPGMEPKTVIQSGIAIAAATALFGAGLMLVNRKKK